jgi:hypothetical protein
VEKGFSLILWDFFGNSVEYSINLGVIECLVAHTHSIKYYAGHKLINLIRAKGGENKLGEARSFCTWSHERKCALIIES